MCKSYETKLLFLLLLVFARSIGSSQYVFGGQDVGKRLPMTTDSPIPASQPDIPDKVKFEDREYDIDTGIQILMDIIEDGSNAPDRRISAMRSLGYLGRLLQDKPCVNQLIDLYSTLDSRELRMAVLDIVITSDDSRTLKLFHDILSREGSELVRFGAAWGLANWNICGGVAELIRLLESTEVLPDGRRLLSQEVIKELNGLNRHKEWGFPAKTVRQQVEQLAGTDTDRDKLYATRWKEWFEANKERFPEWTPEKEHDSRNGAQPEDSPKDRDPHGHTTP